MIDGSANSGNDGGKRQIDLNCSRVFDLRQTSRRTFPILKPLLRLKVFKRILLVIQIRKKGLGLSMKTAKLQSSCWRTTTSSTTTMQPSRQGHPVEREFPGLFRHQDDTRTIHPHTLQDIQVQILTHLSIKMASRNLLYRKCRQN